MVSDRYMKTFQVLRGLVAGATVCICASALGQGNFSTPAYNGTGAGPRPGANRNLSTNLSTSQSTGLGNNLSTSLGQPTGTLGQQAPGTAITSPGGTAIFSPGGTAITAPAGTALNPSGNTTAGTAINPSGTGTGTAPQQGLGIGQQGTTAIGQQGTTAIGQQGTTALGQQGTGTAITPQTNAVVVSPDGATSGLKAQGGVSGAALGGTNVGLGTQLGTNTTSRP